MRGFAPGVLVGISSILPFSIHRRKLTDPFLRMDYLQLLPRTGLIVPGGGLLRLRTERYGSSIIGSRVELLG